MNKEKKSRIFVRFINDSFMIVLFATLISSLGGISLQSIEEEIYLVLPMLVIFPALNALMGNFSIIVSSKFTTFLYEGVFEDGFFKNKKMKQILFQLSVLGLILGLILSLGGILFSVVKERNFDIIYSLKVILTTLIVIEVVFPIMYLIIVSIGYLLYLKNKDPDDFLIPLSTAFADMLSMLCLSFFIILFF